MAQDLKKMFTCVNKDALLLCHKKCGEWLYSFAKIVASTKILLDTADLGAAHKMLATLTEELNLEPSRRILRSEIEVPSDRGHDRQSGL